MPTLDEVWILESAYEYAIDAICATLESAIEYASPGQPWKAEGSDDNYYCNGYYISRREVLP